MSVKNERWDEVDAQTRNCVMAQEGARKYPATQPGIDELAQASELIGTGTGGASQRSGIATEEATP